MQEQKPYKKVYCVFNYSCKHYVTSIEFSKNMASQAIAEPLELVMLDDVADSITSPQLWNLSHLHMFILNLLSPVTRLEHQST